MRTLDVYLGENLIGHITENRVSKCPLFFDK